MLLPANGPGIEPAGVLSVDMTGSPTASVALTSPLQFAKNIEQNAFLKTVVRPARLLADHQRGPAQE